MQRVLQVVLISSTIGFSWLAMMVVHEFGHVLHGWVSGGVVSRVILHPLDFSRTDLSHNPSPVFVAWGGAIWGCVVPVFVFLLTWWARWPFCYLVRFFAGYCLIANGAYIGGGSLIGAGDARDLVRHGAAPWGCVLFGLPAIGLGLWLWDGLGPHFGLGPSEGRVDRRAAVGVAIALVSVVLIELLSSPGV